jgi:23S rRNA (cytidine1920-2'-O)/16S rRNA (cytidine1409-2'-O)-methyltransferase
MSKKRLDNLLVTRELAENQKLAQALIMAGEVTVSGKVITKPGTLVNENIELKLAEKLPYVSRGGIKLAHALDEFKLDVTSLTAVDVGASTGGFTDCLLRSARLQAKARPPSSGHGKSQCPSPLLSTG